MHPSTIKSALWLPIFDCSSHLPYPSLQVFQIQPISVDADFFKIGGNSLLAGKIIGHALLTLGQVVVISVAAPIAINIGGLAELLNVMAPALGWFVPFLCLGFVLLAAMWAVTGSLVSRQEDLGSTTGVVMMLVMGPYFAVMFFSDNATVMTVLSYVPFSAAIAMPVRLFAGEAQVWEPLASLGLLAASVVLIVLVASRVYEGSLLQTGGKVRLSKAWAHVD